MPKLLFSDIDGTLLRDNRTVSDSVLKLLDDMSKKGHGFILSSGRPLISMLDVYQKLDIPFSSAYIIANNGGLIYDCNLKKAIYEARIPLSLIDEIARIAKDFHIHIQTYTETHIVCAKETQELFAYAERIGMSYILSESLSAPLTIAPFKMLALSLKGTDSLMPLKSEIMQKYSDKLICLVSQNGYLEILPKEAGKGNALTFLCHYLNIPVSDSIAVGDSENDIDMLLSAGTSYAMKNSSENVKSSADFVTALDHNHDGIAEILSTILENS